MVNTRNPPRMDSELIHQLQEQRRQNQLTERLLSTKYANLELRLRKERQLLLYQWKSLLSCALFLVYFALVLFRNLAYYRFLPGPVLKDLGHELLPEITDNLELVDIPMYFLLAILASVGMGAFIGHDDPKQRAHEKPYFVNTLRRIMIVFALGHFLRAATYLATSLPGTARQCRVGYEDLDPPRTIAECFTHMVSVNGNCGDLNFSGHVLLMVLGIIFLRQFGPRLWNYEPDGYIDITIRSCAIGLSIVQVILILASRHHYTVDIVLGAYTTPMLWHFFDGYFKDLEPDAGAIETELARESTWPRWLRIVNVIASLVLVLFFVFSLMIAVKGNLKGIIG